MNAVSGDERVFISEVWEDPKARRFTFYCRELGIFSTGRTKAEARRSMRAKILLWARHDRQKGLIDPHWPQGSLCEDLLRLRAAKASTLHDPDQIKPVPMS